MNSVTQVAEKTGTESSWRDFQLVMAGAAALSLLTLASEPGPFLGPPKLVLSLAYVLYVPGYWLVALFFPRPDDLDFFERLGASVGLSIAVVPVLALSLEWLRFGIRPWTILLAEFGATALFMALALWRRFRLKSRGRSIYTPHPAWHPTVWWRAATADERRIAGLLVGALLLASLSMAWVFLTPSSKEFLTEFYVLGKAGLAEDYPYEAALADDVVATIGITNRESGQPIYRIEVWLVDPWNPERRALMGQEDTITLFPGQSREQPISWRAPWPGDGLQVQFLLFAGDDSQPYRQLRLWLNVGTRLPAP